VVAAALEPPLQAVATRVTTPARATRGVRRCVKF
jgi:hypothetical protein